VFGINTDKEGDPMKSEYRSHELKSHNSYSRGVAHISRDLLVQDNIVFEEVLGKFQKISEEEVVSEG